MPEETSPESDSPPDLDDPELAEQAKIVDDDIDAAVEFWRNHAVEGFKGLPGASET